MDSTDVPRGQGFATAGRTGKTDMEGVAHVVYKGGWSSAPWSNTRADSAKAGVRVGQGIVRSSGRQLGEPRPRWSPAANGPPALGDWAACFPRTTMGKVVFHPMLVTWKFHFWDSLVSLGVEGGRTLDTGPLAEETTV